MPPTHRWRRSHSRAVGHCSRGLTHWCCRLRGTTRCNSTTVQYRSSVRNPRLGHRHNNRFLSRSRKSATSSHTPRHCKPSGCRQGQPRYPSHSRTASHPCRTCCTARSTDTCHSDQRTMSCWCSTLPYQYRSFRSLKSRCRFVDTRSSHRHSTHLGRRYHRLPTIGRTHCSTMSRCRHRSCSTCMRSACSHGRSNDNHS